MTYSSWRGIFFVNVPIGIVLFFLAVAFVPHSALRTHAGLDIAGVATTIVWSIAAVNYAMDTMTKNKMAWWLWRCTRRSRVGCGGRDGCDWHLDRLYSACRQATE